MNLSLKLLWRDWRGGELNVLIAALLVAVTTVTSIGLFTDRIRNSILDEAGTLLAADAQIRGGSREAIDDAVRASAAAAGLQTADMITFQAMAFGADGNLQLSSVKAVSDAYPLKGELVLADEPFGIGRVVTAAPAPGEAWLTSRLFPALGIKIGDTIGLGNADFVVTAALISEPDSAGSFFGVGPRVLINAADVDKTGAVQPGSRVRYRLLLGGDVASFQPVFEREYSDDYRWVDPSEANDGITSALERAESFLMLAGSLGVMLAGVALALASRRYADRQLGHVALLKTLGLTPRRIAWLYAGNLMLLGLIVVFAGLALGWLLHWGFLELAGDLLPRELEPAGIRPLLIGWLTGVICLLAFAFPPVWVLRQTPPARVLRSELEGGTLGRRLTLALGATAVIFLVWLYSGDLWLTAALLGGGLVTILGVSVLAALLIVLVRRYGSRLGTTWRLGLANLQRHSRQNAFQIMVFAIALMLLFVLTLLRSSLIGEWQSQLPEGAPNHFAFNLFEDERPGFEAILDNASVDREPFYPMIRGRLSEVDGEAMDDRLERLQPDGDDFRRELNLTWSNTLADDNEIVAGRWWQDDDAESTRVSVEQDFAEELAINIGDTLTFDIGGQTVSAEVASIRTVQWDSMAPNFYLIFNHPILDGAGAAYLTSFYLSPEQKPLLAGLMREYPTVTLIEVDAIIEQIQSIVGQVTVAVEFILALVLVAGFIVLLASVQATLDVRLVESAILRTLGAKAALVRGGLWIEFAALGALAGLLGAFGAEAALAYFQVEMLNLDWTPHWLLWLSGPVVGAVVIGAIGVVSTRKVIRVPPMVVLKSV
ncbi:ABC transporter permease [Saccharospirillum mangrovi]|uniref:ABC transporter permease n=1 Tax=Saccharospirillum mangrovi TaxID=2161747 RepID=UPI000D338849|nr:FtsX-like permease family protein [Saccharospirillum mangrovi]